MGLYSVDGHLVTVDSNLMGESNIFLLTYFEPTADGYAKCYQGSGTKPTQIWSRGIQDTTFGRMHTGRIVDDMRFSFDSKVSDYILSNPIQIEVVVKESSYYNWAFLGCNLSQSVLQMHNGSDYVNCVIQGKAYQQRVLYNNATSSDYFYSDPDGRNYFTQTCCNNMVTNHDWVHYVYMLDIANNTVLMFFNGKIAAKITLDTECIDTVTKSINNNGFNISVSDTGRTDRQYAQLVMKKAEWTETKNYTVPSPYITFN